MPNIFSFPVSDLRETGRVTLVCFLTSHGQEDDLLDEIRNYCDQSTPPDDVLLIGPSYKQKDLSVLCKSKRLQTRLPGASRYVDTPTVTHICFDASGLQKSDFKNIEKVVQTGMLTLFQRYNGLIHGSPAFHYIKPSGRHCDGFLRTANVLVRGVEIEFISACCLAACPAEMNRIYTDTGAIHSIAFAMLRLFSKFGDQRSECVLDSFGSYSGLRAFSFLDADRSLVLISASTSGRLTNDVIAHAKIGREHISTVYYLGKDAKSQNAVCDLSFHASDNPDGLELIQSYSADSCPMCTGSTAVRISEEQFIPEGPQVEPVLIVAKDAPIKTSGFFKPFVGRGVFRANYREQESSSASQEVYLDLLPLFSTDLFYDVDGFQSTFDRFASHLVSANTKRIVHLNDNASKHFAGRIGAFANQNGVQMVNIVSAKELQASSGKEPQQGGTTIVAASAVSTGRALSEVSKSLRFAQVGGAIKYTIAFCRTKDGELSTSLQKDLAFGANDPQEHSVTTMYEFFFPAWRPERCNSWEDELEMLSDVFRPLPEELDQRREELRLSMSANVRGLGDNLFLPSRSGKKLELRPSFAFWNFDYSEHCFGEGRRPSHADVYATIVAVLHNLRRAKRGSDRSLRQTDHVRRVISPRCFERFNDGIIQACFLRAAHAAELDYSCDDGLSEDMRSIIATIFDQAMTNVGEAANEFLLALARGRLQLCPTHMASLNAERDHPASDPIASYLWDRIEERYNLSHVQC